MTLRLTATQPTVGAGYAKGLLDFAVSKQARLDALLARSGISDEDLADLDNRIPFEKYKALMRAGIELTRDPALALHFGEDVDFAELSVVGLIALASDTLFHAFTETNRYNGLVVQVDGVAPGRRFQLVHEPGKTWLVDTRTDANSFPELTESGWARMVCGTRRFIPEGRVLVKEVHVTHAAPAYRAEYDRIFRVPTVFSSERNALLIDETLMFTKVARTTRYAFGVLSEHAKALLDSLERATTTRGRVESILIPMLHRGEPSIDEVANEMGFSHQTLYRKLKAEQVTFEKLLDELRHRMALHYLNGKKVSVSEAAYLVGFSESSAFSRAFKRWTGTSPRKRPK
ncbi:MAG: AraC family transcriptional regulator [Alphaproteobacteria bacterium]|nr:AraC family transcriptional regulator [Alphaproteobacteria bacterium]